MLPLLIGGALLGAAKYSQDKKQAAADRQTAAATARYSPWTGMKPGELHNPSMLGDVMQGGLAGAGLSQSMDAQDSATALNNAKIQQMGGGAAPQQDDGQIDEQAMNQQPGSAWTGMNAKKMGSAGSYFQSMA